MNLRSPAFENGGRIPSHFTCDGENVNPRLIIEDVPESAKSLALIVDDPDSPSKVFVHWLLYNIPITDGIAEDSAPGNQGTNDFGKNAYGGPCPHGGEHRYRFRLYALDETLSERDGLSREALERAMDKHVIATAELDGRYRRSE